ncbi:MAG: hypothetical protein M5U05_12280 [Anaerolineales bacterium]|nr:hypothetical protein [Anaerolineales bacterium]
MTLFDRLILLVTGLVAIFLIMYFYREYANKPTQRKYSLYYLAAFAVLLVAGLLLIALTYSVLNSPLVVAVAALIPLCLSVGMIGEFFPQWEKGYLVFAVIGFLALAITRFTGPAGLATIVLIIVHSIAGLVVFLLPFAVVNQKKAASGLCVGRGGRRADRLGRHCTGFPEDRSPTPVLQRGFRVHHPSAAAAVDGAGVCPGLYQKVRLTGAREANPLI